MGDTEFDPHGRARCTGKSPADGWHRRAPPRFIGQCQIFLFLNGFAGFLNGFALMRDPSPGAKSIEGRPGGAPRRGLIPPWAYVILASEPVHAGTGIG